MSSYVVSARKYRPTRFSEVVGQEHVSQTLKNALKEDHLAQAFLFCGPRGVGKTTCARILAKALNCQQLTEEHEPCNECPSCTAFNENASLNITELDAASNNSVEHIRTLIDQVRIPPQQGRYRIFIIDEVHMLSNSAFNAFLKTLEEPPAHAVFILATTEKHKILPTILSRCQIYDFKRIGAADIKKQLQYICEQEGIEAEEQALHIIAQKADGALRDALSIFDRISSFSGRKITYRTVIENLHILDYDYYFQFIEALLSEDLPKVLLLFDEILRAGFEGDLFMQGLATHLRDLLVCKDPATRSLLEVGEALQNRYIEQAQSTPPVFLLSALNIATESELQYKLAKNKRLHIEMALIKMCYILRAKEAAEQSTSPEKKSPELKENQVREPAKPAYAKSNPRQQPPQKTAEQKKTTPASPLKTTDRNHTPPPPPPPRASEDILSQIDKAVSKKRQKTQQQNTPITTEMLQTLWDAYLDQINSDLLRNTMRKARLEYKNETLHVLVTSPISQANLQQETGLIEHLRKGANNPSLRWEIHIDQEEAAKLKEQTRTPKKKTPKEKYRDMLQTNPLVEKLRLELDLQIVPAGSS